MSTEMTTDQAALDRLKRFGGGKLLREMISLFLSAVPERLAAARDAVRGGDAPGAELSLHSLKSSSAQLGAPRMQKLAERGERLAREGALGQVEAVIAELEAEFAEVQPWLTSARDEEST